ncbi:hypothetical protein WJX79_001197 [Trebouxia sp. C0005]
MDKPNFDGPEFQDVDGYNNTASASVPSAMTGRTGPAQNLGPGAANDLKTVKKKKRKTLAQRLAPKRLVRQTLTGVKGAADRVESMVRGDSWTRKHRARRESVDPVKMAADTAYRRRTKDLETLTEDGEQKAPAASDSRTVDLAGGQPADKTLGFATNNIKTAKYNLLTFFPIFLFEMFSRAAYLYFLAQACLAWWNVVSPFGGFGSTAALAFVLIVAAVKAIFEDKKRHQEDHRTNKSTAHVVHADGSVEDMKWENVQVGQVLQVKDDELFPADLLCLYTALPDRVCFIKTTNLDGESNLKIRRPVDLKENAPENINEVMKTTGSLQCEIPNANLHHFKGRFQFLAEDSNQGQARAVPVTMNEMLLRGCTLKNTGHILGLAVYTGNETRIQKNSAKTPNKIGSYDRFLNLQIGLIIGMQLLMCLFCSIASLIWREHSGKERYYLGMTEYVQGNYKSGGVYWIILMITFWILYSYLVPISLFVSLEIVKFWQGFLYINHDREMKDPTSGEYAKARNSNLNEDLGKVEYVFSDKTGTLTSNEMQLREVAIKTIPLGSAEFKLEEHVEWTGPETLRKFDKRMAAATDGLKEGLNWGEIVNSGGSPAPLLAIHTSHPTEQMLEEMDLGDMGPSPAPTPQPSTVWSRGAHAHGQAHDADHDANDSAEDEDMDDTVLGFHTADFWLNICVCHSLIVEQKEGAARPSFQGPSPDEVALVEGGRQLGFEFLSRTMQGVTLRMLGHEATFDVLNMMEFSSERGRMSVIARSPDGTIRLYAKGADSKMLATLNKNTNQELLDQTARNLHLFATQGLRTLVLGTKVLSEEVWADWDSRYQDAAAQLDNRDEALAALAVEIEADLEFVGVTAIEDKLQEGVPAAIQSLLDAGMKVWVITGDKQETAINIAISCKLIRHPDSLLICNADSPEEAAQRISDLTAQVGQTRGVPKGAGAPHPAPKRKTGLFGRLSRMSGNLNPFEEEEANPRHHQNLQMTVGKVGELVIDGKTLEHVLRTPQEPLLAQLGSRCGSVVICRASPSQKAAIVRMMAEFEMKKAEGGSKGIQRWLKRQQRRLSGKMLGIGDGANDVAMIQAADVGVGIMGKEGRQAVNNSDYAIGQFRFLVRLLLVHGSLSSYRLSRLIKYSFYKNISFAFVLFFYQFYNGFSGQALVDDISAAAFNVVFTSVPILLFAVLDRPVINFSTLIQYPQVYNNQKSLTTRVFWKSGVGMALLDAAIAFFIPYYSIVEAGQNSITDVYSVGKVVFICLLSAVTLEICVIARYWTWPFLIFVLLSYWLVYPFEVVFPAIEKGISYYDPGQWGVGENVFRSPTFWFVQITVACTCFGHRYLERAVVWLFHPQDNMILEEIEAQHGGPDGGEMGWQTKQRLNMLGVSGVGTPAVKADPENPEAARGLMNGHSHSDAQEHMHELPVSNGTGPYGSPNVSGHSTPKPPTAPGTLPKSDGPNRGVPIIQAIDDDRQRQAGQASQGYFAQQQQPPNGVNIMDQPQVAPFDMPAELEMTHQPSSGNPFGQGALPPSTAWQ